MSSQFDLISDITCTKMQWNLKVRVVRLYYVQDRENIDNPYSLDMVLQDQEGNRIHATISRKYISMFKTKVKEHGLYFMRNFVVGPNNLKFKTNKHKLKLTFTHRTFVEESNDPQFGMSIFNLRAYDELINGVDIDDTELFDIIGEVISYSDVQTHTSSGKTSMFMDIELHDYDENKIKATFWGDFVDQIVPHLAGSIDQPVIVVMQLVRTHKFQGQYSVRNTWHASKLFINAELPQVTEFKSRLINARGDTPIAISQVSSQQSLGVSDELASGNIALKSICQLIACHHEESVWILATIVLIEIKQNWSYLGCKRCSKKVDKMGGKFYCPKCDRLDHSAIHRLDYNIDFLNDLLICYFKHSSSCFTLRFRFQVRVMDGTGFISLLLFDREAAKLIGKSANDLKEGLVENSFDANDSTYPMDIDVILEKRVLFKVLIQSKNINEENEVYTVKALCDDEDIIKHCNHSSSEDAFPDPDFTNGQFPGGENDLTDSVADNDISSPTMTPAKRCRSENEVDVVEVHDLNGQLSSNKAKPVVVKKEKK